MFIDVEPGTVQTLSDRAHSDHTHKAASMTSVRMKNFDRSIEGTLHLYNLKGIHFKPQTRLALADVKVIISMPDACALNTTGLYRENCFEACSQASRCRWLSPVS